MTTSKPAEDARDPCVFLRVPREAWGLLRETLERDSSSSAFDPALRVEIREALEQVEEIPPPPESGRSQRGFAEGGASRAGMDRTDGGEAECRDRLREVVERHSESTSSRAIFPAAAAPALRRVFDLLYLDIDRTGDFYSPDKAWAANVWDAVATVVRPFFTHLFQNQEERDDEAL